MQSYSYMPYIFTCYINSIINHLKAGSISNWTTVHKNDNVDLHNHSLANHVQIFLFVYKLTLQLSPRIWIDV